VSFEDHASPSVAGGPGSASAGAETVAPRRRRLLSVALSVLVFLLAAVVAAAFIQLPYYAITPGSGIDVASLIVVPKRLHHAHGGRFLLTDVELVRLRAINYLYYRWNSADQVVPSSALTNGATSTEYDQQGVIDMANAQQAATVVALQTVGYHVGATPTGVIVYQLEAGAPAAGRLVVGDVITAVGGTTATTSSALRAILAKAAPGQAEALAVHEFGTKRRRTVRLRLGQERVRGTGSDAEVVCLAAGQHTTLPAPPAGYPRACLGILTEQEYKTVGSPFPVSIQSDGIIGPSAGLAFTLGLINELDRGDLTGGRRVAATGTMSVDGQVGDVGGVAQKTAAVRAAGATVFIVPSQALATAKAHAGAGLTVLGVSTVRQAIADLERLGGKLRVRPGG